MRAKLP